MPEIIPAINAETFEDVSAKMKKIEPHTKWVHIDVADGTFTPNTLWHHAADLQSIDTPLSIEAHLMIRDIDTRYKEWLIPQVERILIHFEAGHDIGLVIKKIKEAGKEVVLGVLPATPWEEAKPFWKMVDGILLLSVSPGVAGQVMHENTADKIHGLHNACPNCIIEVDGGVNAENARELAKFGAHRLVAASAIWKHDDIGKAIDELRNF